MKRNTHASRSECRYRASLILAGVLSCGLLGGCGKGVTPEQTAAIARFQEIGGRVNVKRGGYEVDLTKTAVEDSDLAHLKHLSNLKNIDLQGTGVGDVGIDNLMGIESLEYVYLQRTKCTPEKVEALKKTIPKAEVRF